MGETPNLAARLQALAEPGRVVIAASTRRLLGGLFELVDLAAHDLKGFGAPVAAFAVEGERTTHRFEARSGPAPLAMVGRDQELGLLLERWALAKAGEGQGVLLVGEAGNRQIADQSRPARHPRRGAALSGPLSVLALPHR